MNLEKLKKAVHGEFAAVRRITRLEPQGEKIFPPTYEGGQYATEDRQVRDPDGKLHKVPTVLLDSVQSQANRMELALLKAVDAKKIRMPILAVDFGADTEDPVLREVGRLTALETPHRMCDAIFRDSVLDGVPFRQSPLGNELNSAKSTNATPVLKMCPSALVFGFWDSTGPRGGLGAKVQRALVSEIVGYECESGKRPASRLDPLQIQNNVLIYKRAGGGWTFDETLAERTNEGPRAVDSTGINHSNIPPSLTHDVKVKGKKNVRELNHGGVTLAYAVQHTVLSLAALRRLRFPVNGTANAEGDGAARTVLAALGLAAICFLDQDGYDLRSRCLLDGAPGPFQLVGGGKAENFQLDADGAATLLAEAATEAQGLGLPWPESLAVLSPSEDLRRLVSESRSRAMAADSEG
jgi:CRISPR-associated protein Csb1